MGLGLANKFNILQQSPHDLNIPESGAETISKPEPGAARWVPSRYNVRAVTQDGRLVLWNTYRRTMSVFGAAQRPSIESLLRKPGFEARSKGIVKYLFDRGFLLKEGTDEYRRFQVAFGQQHYRTDVLELTLLASEDCNFRCQYCYEEFARGTMQPGVRKGVKSLVESRLKGLRHLYISWFGGEPLYGLKAIEDLAPFFLETAEKNSLTYSSGMTTNGYLLTPEVADKLLAWRINKYQITIDGTPEDHDRNRPTRDGQGTFWTILNNLRSLRQRPDDFAVDIRVNWDKRNQPKLPEFLNLIEAEFGGDSRFRVRFHPIFKTGGPNDAQLDVCGVDESADLQRELEREARKRGLSLGDDLRRVAPVSSGVCYAARPYHFIIGASGKVMKCTIELDMADRNVVGHLTEEGDLQLDQDKMSLWCEPAYEKDKKCQKCVVLPICSGSSCPLIRFETKSSPCVPLRHNAKSMLRGTVEAAGESGRKATIDAESGRQLRSDNDGALGVPM